LTAKRHWSTTIVSRHLALSRCGASMLANDSRIATPAEHLSMLHCA
jgi:hypothetical protein